MVSSTQHLLRAAAVPLIVSAATPAFISSARTTRTTQFGKIQGQGDDKVWAVDESEQTANAPVQFKIPNPFAEIAASLLLSCSIVLLLLMA